MTVTFQLIMPTTAPRWRPSPQALARPSERAAEVVANIDAILAAVGTRAASRRAIADIDAALRTRRSVEWRSTATETVAVDRAARIVRVVAVPYEAPAAVPFRGTIWREVFSRGAFDGIQSRTNTTIRVNRDHDRTRTVGKVIQFDPADPRGLIAEIQIARTPLGDETLALAEEDCLSASVAFMVPGGGEQLDHNARLRRIVRATLDHVALVENPAYVGASVLSAVS